MTEETPVNQVDTFIYDSKEYRLTGRIATKKASALSRNETHMIEIRPISAPADDPSYDQWVNADDLYIVHNDDLDDIDE